MTIPHHADKKPVPPVSAGEDVAARNDRQLPGDAPAVSRPWLMLAGWLLFALGVIGMVLPVMPTTVFWIGAVWCWARSAPRLTHRVLSHPRFGPPVERFLTRGEMTRQGKWAAIGGIAFGYLLMQVLARPGWLTAGLVAVTLLLVALWLWSRPEPAVDGASGSRT